MKGKTRRWMIYMVIMMGLFCLMAVPAFADGNNDPGGEITSITFTPVNPEMYRLDYNTHGDADGSGGFHYFIPRIFYDGDVCTVTVRKADQTTVKKDYRFTQKRGEFVEKTSESDTLAHDFFTKSEVKRNVGGDYYISVSCTGASCTYPVTITKLKKIEYIPATNIVRNEGVGCDPDTGQYYVTGILKKGDRLITTAEDGTVREYTYKTAYVWGGNEKRTCFVCDDTGGVINAYENYQDLFFGTDQDEVPWELGTYAEHPGNYIWVAYSDQKCKVPITLEENPIASISCKPAEPFELIENADGWKDEETGVFIYNYPTWHEGDQLTVVYKDGKKKTYTYGENEGIEWTDETSGLPFGTADAIMMIDSQSSSDPWLINKDNKLTIAFFGRTCTVPVRVVANDFVGFSYIPLHRFVWAENYGGDVFSTFFEYELQKDIYPGDRIVMQCKDGGTKEYVANKKGSYGSGRYVFVNTSDKNDVIDPLKEGNWISFNWPPAQNSYEERWLPGKDNKMYISFRNFVTEVPVVIIPATDRFKKAVAKLEKLYRTIGGAEDMRDGDVDAVLGVWEAFQKLPEDEQTAFENARTADPLEAFMDKVNEFKKTKPTVIFTPKELTYNGKVQTPKVAVKRGTVVLRKNTDYTITTPKSKNIGEYAVKISLKNKYKLSASAKYQIVPKGTTISKLTKGSKQMTVQWKKQASQTNGYQIRYSLKSDFGSGVKTVTVSKTGTTKRVIKGLTSKKTYHVQVRTYKKVSGKKYYSTWSKTKSITIK